MVIIRKSAAPSRAAHPLVAAAEAELFEAQKALVQARAERLSARWSDRDRAAAKLARAQELVGYLAARLDRCRLTFGKES